MARVRHRSSGSADLTLIGFGLVGAGLVAGGAGFSVLGYCSDEDNPCSDAVIGVGWGLAAPGIPPLLIGAFFVWAGSETADAPATRGWAGVNVDVQSVPGGGVLQVSGSF